MNLATTLDDPVGAVRSLTEQIRAECGDMDATRALPAAVVGALRQAGASASGPGRVRRTRGRPGDVPQRRRGGVARRRIGRMVRSDRRLLRHIRRPPPRHWRPRHGRRPDTISAAAFRPDGITIEVDGGYRVSGRWPLASGSSHANWYLGGCALVRHGEAVTDPSGPVPGRCSSPPRSPRSSTPGTRPTTGHGKPRLRGRRCVRPHLSHDVVPRATDHRAASLPHAARRHVRHLHRRRTPGHRPSRR